MTRTNPYKVGRLTDTLLVGQWVQLARHEPAPVYQVRQVDHPGERVELADGVRDPFWAPFWMINSEYRQVAQ